MGVSKDLTGTTVNGLLVLGLAYNNGRNCWRVQCHCGLERRPMLTAELNRFKGGCVCKSMVENHEAKYFKNCEFSHKARNHRWYKATCRNCEKIHTLSTSQLVKDVNVCGCPVQEILEEDEVNVKVRLFSRVGYADTLVSKDRYHEKVKMHHWYFNPMGYLFTRINGKLTPLHRVILDVPTGMVVDHIDGDTLNNTDRNLRVVTQKENSRNCAIAKNNKSGTTGVVEYSPGKYLACIHVDYKHIHLGCFDNKVEAIAARKEAEVYYNFHPNHGRETVDLSDKIGEQHEQRNTQLR